MLNETAAVVGLHLCNPFTSAACIAKTLAGTAAGFAIGGVPGASIGGVAGNTGAVGAAAHAVAGAAANTAVGALASAIQDALRTVVQATVAWWIHLPSPDLTTDPGTAAIQRWLWPFTVTVALLGFITSGIRMMVTRKSAPLADVGAGLLTMACTTAVGTLLPTMLLKAGDSFSDYVLNASTGGDFAARFTDLVVVGSITTGGASAGLIIILGIFAIIMATVQAILLLFRMGSVIILAGTLPLAAAGQMSPLTKPWLRKQIGWIFALIFYKPAAAAVYGTGFVLFGNGKSAQDLFMGFAVMLLSLIALPVLLKFFTWTTGNLESGAGGGLLGAVMGGASAVGAMRGYGGMSAAGQAGNVSSSLGAPGGGQGAPAAGGGAPGGGAAAGGGSGPGGGKPPGGGQGAPAAGGGAPGGGAAAAGGAAPAATGAAAAGGGGAAAMGAAGGPVGLIAAGSVQAVSSAASGARQAADSVISAPGGQS